MILNDIWKEGPKVAENLRLQYINKDFENYFQLNQIIFVLDVVFTCHIQMKFCISSITAQREELKLFLNTEKDKFTKMFFASIILNLVKADSGREQIHISNASWCLEMNKSFMHDPLTHELTRSKNTHRQTSTWQKPCWGHYHPPLNVIFIYASTTQGFLRSKHSQFELGWRRLVKELKKKISHRTKYHNSY